MFEFYFQSGEFLTDSSTLWTDLFIQAVAWILAGVTAFFVFKSQQKIYIKNRQNEKLDVEKDKLIYLSYLVKKSIEFGDRLVKGLHDFANELNDNSFDIGDVKYDIEDNLIRLSVRINQEDYFHAFRNQLDKNDLSPVFYGIDVIKSVKDELFNYMTRYKLEVDYSRKSEFEKLIVRARDILLDKCRFLKKHESKEINRYNIYNQFLVIHQKTVNKKHTNLKAQFEEFIFPFRELIVKDINNETSVVETDVVDVITTAYKKYNEIITSNEFFLKKVRERTRQIEQALDVVKMNSILLLERYRTS